MQKDCFNRPSSTTTGSRPNSLPYEGRSGDGSSTGFRPNSPHYEGGARGRVYGRSELDQLYYGRPISDRGARRWFMRELSYVPGIMEKLNALGFTSKGKIFTPTQVAVIFESLGEP